MLVRTFRLTDKFSNALLRIAIWLGEMLLLQTYQLRVALIHAFEAFLFTVTTARAGGFQNSDERRRAIMARRTAEAAARPVIREDPLKTQNRALSMFTVGLMASLLVLVLWFTGSGQIGGTQALRSSNESIVLNTVAAPTGLPTIIPTTTPVPDVLQGGSIVYTVHQGGRDTLWVHGIGQTKEPKPLPNASADDRDPVWSPDGTQIAFMSHRDGNWELYTMNIATGETSRLTFGLTYEGAPTWSPDGKWLAYEGYDGNNLDIYIIPSNGAGTNGPIRLTANAAPDFTPAWSPSGDQIAYVTLRDGNKEIYIASLRPSLNEQAVRFTATREVDETFPTWSPDGQTLAYSAHVNGLDLVYAKPISQPDANPLTIGQGHQPTWAPNGTSLIAALDHGSSTTLLGAQFGNVGVMALAIDVNARASHPSWTGAKLPQSLVELEGTGNTASKVLPYEEKVNFSAPQPPFNRLVTLNGINAESNPYLSDKVDDSFVALRQTSVQQIGFDFLGSLKGVMWQTDRFPDPGQTRQSWHYAGRAFDFDENLVFGTPAPIEVVREEVGVNTYWRVYVRVPEMLQGGQLGEPLRDIPWDFASRTSGDPQTFENGGRPKNAIPSGYYVDFTAMAEDFGWMRIPSERDWRRSFTSLLYWEFNKREGLSWNEAMLELYTQDQIVAFLTGPTPIPTPVAPPTERPEPRTPTPIPPDQQAQ
jgi:TolB protein